MFRAKRKPHLAWLHTHFLTNTGGTRFIFEVAIRLKKDFDLEIFVERTNLTWSNKFAREGIKVTPLLPLTSTNILYWLSLPFWLYKSHMALKTKTAHADIVMSSMFPMNYLANMLDKPHLQICYEPFAFFHDRHFVASFSLPKQIFIKLVAVLYRRLDFKGTLQATNILTPNEGVASQVRKVYDRTADGHTFIGVDTRLFIPTSDQKIKRLFPGKKLVMHSTDYTAIKGTDLLIQSLPYLAKKLKNFKVIITESVSDHNAKLPLINLAKNLEVDQYLHFTGQLTYEDLPKYYSVADVYAFSGNPASKAATSASLSVLESLACQTPAIRSPGTTDEVVDGKSGYIVDPRQKKKYGLKLAYLLTHPALARRMGQWGRKYIQSHYTWNHVVKNISQCLNTYVQK